MTDGFTIEKLREAMEKVQALKGAPPFSGFMGGLYGGLKVVENPFLVETEEYEGEVERSFYDRWVYPVFEDPITTPFEPWVRTRKVMRTRTVPSRKVLLMGDLVFMHPSMKSEFYLMTKENPE